MYIQVCLVGSRRRWHAVALPHARFPVCHSATLNTRLVLVHRSSTTIFNPFFS